MRLNSVVLPAPFGPMIEKTWPGATAKIHVVDGVHAAEGNRQVLGGEDGHARLAASALASVGTMPARRKIMSTITIRPSTMCS